MIISKEIQLSIIIPTYNSELTLSKCLESIISQDYKRFEILLIDGISSDNTLKIITSYQLQYQYINYISEADKGIYDAMNKGISLAKGDWLYFLGSDDTLYNNYVLKEIFDKIKNDNPEIIYGSVVMRGKNQWNLENVVFDGKYCIEKFLERNICHQAILYKKTVFKKNGAFNLKYITCADFDFNLRCYANTEFTYLNIIIANFFVGGKSTTVKDYEFPIDRGALLMKYFGKRIFTSSFINTRLYIQQAAFLKSSPLNLFERVYCLIAYIKLKIMALFIQDTSRDV